jgi:hypothetical protein
MQMRCCFIYLVAYNTMVKIEFRMDIIWIRLIIFKNLYFVVGDVADDVDHLHVKRIHLVGFSYIVIEDYLRFDSS